MKASKVLYGLNTFICAFTFVTCITEKAGGSAIMGWLVATLFAFVIFIEE